MWLAAMNEGLQGLFVLSAILFWDRQRYTLSVICFSLALVSKESAVIMLLMVPLWQAMRGRPVFPKAYFGFLIPASILAFVFFVHGFPQLHADVRKLRHRVSGATGNCEDVIPIDVAVVVHIACNCCL